MGELLPVTGDTWCAGTTPVHIQALHSRHCAIQATCVADAAYCVSRSTACWHGTMNMMLASQPAVHPTLQQLAAHLLNPHACHNPNI